MNKNYIHCKECPETREEAISLAKKAGTSEYLAITDTGKHFRYYTDGDGRIAHSSDEGIIFWHGLVELGEGVVKNVPSVRHASV